MTPSKRTRKPACDLTEDDMRAFPIWEYALDEEGVEEQDESWVRPVSAKKVPAKAYSQLVSAIFKIPSGEVYPGYMVVSPAESSAHELDHSGGALHYRGKQCFLMDLNGPGLEF